MRKGCVKTGAAMLAAVCLLTGCGNSFPSMTEEEEAMVGEYAAMLLLKYDANNRSRLVSYEEVEEREQELLLKQQEPEEPVQEPEDGGMGPVDETPVIEIGQETDNNGTGSMEAFWGLPEGMTIVYQGNEICGSYPQTGEEDAYFSLDAAAGKDLLVLKFRIENMSGEEQYVDLLSQEAIVRVTVNGNYSRNALTTMLMDDLLTYMGSIPTGGSSDVVLLTEVDSDVAEAVSSIELSLKNASKTYTIQLQ